MKEESMKYKQQQENFEDFIRVLGETEEVLKRKVSSYQKFIDYCTVAYHYCV